VTTTGSASRTARAIARDQITRAILGSARTQLASVGPAALSVRAVAREVGMVSSAVYRYFPSRDELLTALLIVCYDELGAAVEEQEAAVLDRGDFLGRWLALARAVRRWALDHPYDFGLLYGSAVPGYAAPGTTVAPATRVTRLVVGLLRDADAAGATPPPAAESAALHASVAGVRAFAGAELSDDLVLRGLLAWSGLVGSVSLELYGHLTNAVTDHDTYFDAVARRLSPVGDG
jgi:AcrR family transcriptional regulator